VPIIWIPALLRHLTEGKEQVCVPGNTLLQAIDNLEGKHPGIKEHLFVANQFRPDITVIIDGTVSHLRLRHTLSENTEVHFLPYSSGG
jgi:molybdopterin converting factor small subunit